MRGCWGVRQPQSASLQTRGGMARKEQGTNRGVLLAELQPGTESGRTAECRLETRHHDKRSEVDTARTLEEGHRTHEAGEGIAGEGQNLLQGQAR